MKTKIEKFEVLVPNQHNSAVAERVMVDIPLRWDEDIAEWLLTTEAHRIIEDTKARHMGLLLPAQLKELRVRIGYSQRQMGELFQVGEKSWIRWENGKHRPSRSINLLIRALYEGEISLEYLLEKAGKTAAGRSWVASRTPIWQHVQRAVLAALSTEESHEDVFPRYIVFCSECHQSGWRISNAPKFHSRQQAMALGLRNVIRMDRSPEKEDVVNPLVDRLKSITVG